ncbi:MAG: hypothetical protein AB7W37_18165 [Syntrophobacteraceae bacterium]
MQKLYFNTSASGTPHNGAKARPYNSFEDHGCTDYSLQTEASPILAGALGSLYHADLSDNGVTSILEADGETASFIDPPPNGVSAAFPTWSGGSSAFLRPVLALILDALNDAWHALSAYRHPSR